MALGSACPVGDLEPLHKQRWIAAGAGAAGGLASVTALSMLYAVSLVSGSS